MLVKCEWCGKVFNRRPSHVFGHVFCSGKCYGKWWAQSHKGKRNPSWKGGKVTKKCEVCGEEMRLFPSELSRRFCSLKCKNKLESTHGGMRNPSKEIRQKLSELARKRWQNPDFREKMSKILRGRTFSDEAKRKMADLWRDNEYVKHVLDGLHRKPTEPEQKMIGICNKHGLPFRYCGDGSFMIDILNPDFIHNNGKKKVIEVFGRVFHDPNKSFFEVSWHRQYWGRMAYYAQFGYDCLIIWDDELENEVEIVEKINSFIKTS